MKDNKLIAEFMGWDIESPTTIPSNLHISNLELDSGEVWAYKFHASWDWLMPVVDRCTQIGFRDTDTDDNPLYELWDRLFCDNMGQFVGNHRDEVYQSVVEFIKENQSMPSSAY